MRAKIHFMLFIIAMICMGVSVGIAATISSNGTGGGDWGLTTTWAGGVVPTSLDNAIIVSSDSVSMTVADSVNSLTIQSGAKLAKTTANSIKVINAFTNLAGGIYYAANGEGSWLTAGSYNINPASNFIYLSAATSTLAKTAPSTFGNLTVLKSGVTCGTSVTILGDLTVNTGGAQNNFKGANTSNPNKTHHVYGNVKIISGQMCAIDVGIGGQYGIWNLHGNVTIGDSSTTLSVARLGCVNSADADSQRIGIINIDGNLRIINGGKLQGGSSTSSVGTKEVSIINLKGNLWTDNTAIYAANTKSWLAINFVGTSVQTVTLGVPIRLASTSMTATLCDTIASGSSVIFSGGSSWSSDPGSAPAHGDGAWVVNGSVAWGMDTLKGIQALFLNSGATLKTGHPNGLSSTGTFQMTGDTGAVLSTSANYEYNGSAAQVTGALLPTTVNNLTINNAGGVTLGAATTVSNTLFLTAGTLHNCTNNVTANSVVTGAGNAE